MRRVLRLHPHGDHGRHHGGRHLPRPAPGGRRRRSRAQARRPETAAEGFELQQRPVCKVDGWEDGERGFKFLPDVRDKKLAHLFSNDYSLDFF